MNRLPRIISWLSRLILLGATIIFTVIGLRFINDPRPAAAAIGIIVSSPLGATTLRIGLGGFPVALALITFACLISRSRHQTGIWFVLTVMATAIAVRLIGVAEDGIVPDSVRLFVPEGLMSMLCIVTLFLQQRRRHDRSTVVAEG